MQDGDHPVSSQAFAVSARFYTLGPLDARKETRRMFSLKLLLFKSRSNAPLRPEPQEQGAL